MHFVLNLAILLATLFGVGDEPYSLTVLHTNDTHGRPLAFKHDEGTAGGIAARKTAVDLIRAKTPNLLVLDAGDVCDGMPVSNMNGVEPDFAGMGLVGYDALAVGNHEFSHDVKKILRFEELAGFPFLCANLVRESTGAHPFKPYVIKERGGRTIAVLGLITPELETLTYKSRLKGLKLLDPVETAKEWVPKLREKADHLIVLSHCGYGYDKNALAKNVSGIDLIVGGHSHTPLTRPRRVGDTVIVQAGCHGLFLGRVTLHFKGRSLDRFDGKESGLIPINFTPKKEKSYRILGPFDEDPEVLARLKPYEEKVSALLGRVVGEVTEPAGERKKGWLDRPFPNLVADAIRWKSGADCAIQNTGGVRTRLDPGPVTVNDVLTMLPFDNNVFVVKLRGRTILDVLKHSVFTIEERPRTFGAVSGMEVVIAPRSDKILSVEINGRPLVEEKVYKVAINSYMFQRGDGYVQFADNEGVIDLGFKYSQPLIDFLEERKIVTPAAEGRIRLK